MDYDNHSIISGALVSSLSIRKEEGRVATNECEAFRLRTNRGLLSIWVDIDTDEICLKVKRGFNQASDDFEHCINREYPFVGQRVGWSWYGRNQQGYRDVLMLAFGKAALTPQLLLLAEASRIRLLRITE
ncbi:MAG: DUF6334 family protein [Pseudomonadota bacterium]